MGHITSTKTPSPIASIQRGLVRVTVGSSAQGTTEVTSVTFDSSKALLLPRVEDPSSSSTLHWQVTITGDNTLQGLVRVQPQAAVLNFDLPYQLIEFV